MIRVLAFLAVVAVLAFGEIWLAEHPGTVVITWQGERLETSVMVLAAVAAALAAAAVLTWSVVRSIIRAPRNVARRLDERRRERAVHAVTQGLVAVGSGNAASARRFAAEAGNTAPDAPLTLLLTAQAAQLSGDRDGAARTFERMAVRDDTRLLGLHGLYIEARRRNDAGGALLYAEEACRHAAVPAWAGQAVLEFRCVAGDWAGAIDRLERNMRAGLTEKAPYRRQRAVLLTAQALAAEDNDRDRAKTLAQEAAKLAPDLVPAAAMAGRMIGEAGDLRRAARIIEAAWIANPHPDLAAAYAHLRPGDSARERLTRIEALAAKAPGNVEAAIAVAHAALDAREFEAARAALVPLITAPTRRVAALMAALEDMQGDQGRSREWMARAVNARRDPAWTADGFVSERWLPVSPVTGRLDVFVWKDPLAGEDHAAGALVHEPRPALEGPRDPSPPSGGERPPAPPSVMPPAAPVVEIAPSGSGANTEKTEAQPRVVEIAPPPAPSETPVAPEPPTREAASVEELRPRRPRLVPQTVPAVIPLVHAPDDPGPEPDTAAEPEPSVAPDTAGDGWNRIRRLLRP